MQSKRRSNERSESGARRHVRSATVAGLVPLLSVTLGITSVAVAQDKLLPPSGQPASVWFGDAGAIDGDTVIVGAPNLDASESAFIYELQNGAWTRTASFTPTASSDYGWAVDVSGDNAAVGAFRGVGSVYMYNRNQGGTGVWGQSQVLTPSNSLATGEFGRSLGLDGSTLVVGAWGTDQAGTNGGSAYVFEHNGTSWAETKILDRGDAGNSANFGWSTAISGDNIIVGAFRHTHITGSGGVDGAAYIYNRNAGGSGNWGQVQKLVPSDGLPGDAFGHSVAISGNTAVVGAPWTDEVDPSTNSRSGSVYIFDFDGTEWVETAQVHASDPQSANGGSGSDGYAFGPNSIATNGDLLVVSSMRHSPAGGAVNDGAIYVYSRNEGGANNWGQVAAIYGELNALDNFGSVVDVDGEHYLVGARFDDDGGSNVGAAYIYAVPEPATAGLVALAGAAVLVRRRAHG